MKARVVYDADGTSEQTFVGHRVSAQLLRGRRALIKVYDEGGALVRIVQLGRVHSIDTDPR